MRSKISANAVREIKGSFGRYFAILAIIALGVGFFSGVKITMPTMVSNMNEYMQEGQLFDYRLISTLGWEEQEVEALRAEEDVRFAEGAYSLDILCSSAGGGSEFVLKAHSMTENINQLKLIEGRIPEAPDECVIDSDMGGMELAGLDGGSEITVLPENEQDTLDSLRYSSFKVVGKVSSPYYVNFERGSTSIGTGSVAGFVYLTRDAFDMDYYSEIFVRFEQDFEIYSDEYNDYMDAHADLWEELTQKQADARYERILDDANAELSDGRSELEDKKAEGQQELDDAKAELEDAEAEINDAEDELADAKKEIDDGEKTLKDSKKELDEAKKEIDENREKLEAAEKELADAKSQLDSTKALLDETAAALESAGAQISAGQAQLDAAEAELSASEAQFAAAERELIANETAFNEQYGAYLAILDQLPPEQRQMILAAQQQLADARRQLEASRAQLAAGRAELDRQRTEFNAKKAEYEAGVAQYNEGLAQYNSGLALYQASLAEYESGKAAFEEGEKLYEDGLKEYEDAVQKLKDGKQDYEDGLKKFEDGKTEYEDGLGEYEDALKEFDEKIKDAESELADAEKEIADLDEPDTFVLGRGTNIGYACFENDSEIVAQVAKVFPIFFILVAALVCMTTMSRMVEEQRTQIGVFKALGYSNAAIMGKLMFYSGSAAAIGAVSGYTAGTLLFPRIIWMTYQLMYIPLEMKYMFDPQLAIIAGAVSLLCSIGTTWVSCRRELAETAASLMRPKAPKAGKRVLLERIPLIWNRMKFLHKVSVRNIFRYKKRLFMMIVGISGCTALLVTGFGLKDSVAGFADVQYGEVFVTDAALTFTPERGELPAKLQSVLDEQTSGYKLIRESSWDLVTADKTKSVTLEIPEDYGGMDSFVRFMTTEGEPIAVPQKGEAIVSQSLQERYGVNLGDEMTLRDDKMRELHLTVAGVFENHVYNYVFASAESFSEQLGEEVEFNGAFMNFPEGSDDHAVAAEIGKNKSVRNITLYSELMERMRKTMSSLDYVVLLVIVCAAGLAFIVLYNLTNINITERIREIATIKVLGFFRNETSAYVLRENITLTALGIAVGLGLGILLHRFVMQQIVVDMVTFRVRVLPMSFVYSIALTFLFNFLVDLVMEGKLEKINMAESLKSVD